MKSSRIRKSLHFIIIALICMVVFGCRKVSILDRQEQSQQNLVDIFEKTKDYDSGLINTDVAIEMKFNDDILTEEELKRCEKFRNIYINSKYRFDAMNNYVLEITPVISGSGYRASLYHVDDNFMLKVPIYNQYIDLTDSRFLSNYFLNNNDDLIIYDQVVGAFKDGLDPDRLTDITPYLELIHNKKVDVYKERILTNNGNIKATVYQQELDNEDIEMYLQKVWNHTYISDMMSEFNKSKDEWKVIATVKTYSSNKGILIKEDIEIKGEKYSDFKDKYNEYTVFEGKVDVVIIPVESFKINISVDYTELGMQQEIVLPQITEGNLINQEKLQVILDQFMKYE